MQNNLSVSQLNNYIKGVFEDELILSGITVFGEIFERTDVGGNVFFTLRDEFSALRCVRFGGGFVPNVGEKALVTGSVEYYAKSARVTFKARDVKPFGEGEINRRLNELKAKLFAEGLFEKRLSLPAFIRKIAVVTSAEGAVIHDMTSVLSGCAYLDIVVYPTRVQGEGSETEIAEAVNRASSDDNGCDVIILARGGGSEGDLAAFNTEVAARAVAGSKKPIISAVGHEINYALCDFCATERAGTPSIAAEIVRSVNERFISRMFDLATRARTAVKSKFDGELGRLKSRASKFETRMQGGYYRGAERVAALVRRARTAAEKRLGNEIARALNLIETAKRTANDKLTRSDERLGRAVARLNALSPLRLIEKGYVRAESGGKPLTSVRALRCGDEITIAARDGEAKATVTDVIAVKE